MLSAIASTVLSFIWHILSGKAYGLWQNHKEKEKAQDVANAPINAKEEAEGLLK